MARYECDVCGFVYDEDKEGMRWAELPKDWKCPACDAEKDFFKKIIEDVKVQTPDGQIEIEIKEKEGGYLSEWRRKGDELEIAMAQIHRIAETGQSLVEPMRTRKPLVSWDDVLIKGAQLAKIPIDKDTDVNTKTVIGKKAKHPLVIDTPIFVSHMSFGALSKEAKTALAKGTSMVKTAVCSGEGGILKEELDNSYRYIFEVVPNEYSLTDEYLKRVDAIEIKIGQGTKPGMGGHLPADKVTDEIASVRMKEPGKDIHSPAFFRDIRSKDDLRSKVENLRERSGGKPVGIKVAAGNIEADLEIALHAGPDFITIDGRGGATGSSPKYLKDATSVPTLYALARARRFLDSKKAEDVALIITGGLRISPDFAKALALGADAVAIATAAMVACGCQQYRVCNTGKCPVGIATQDPELRKRLKVGLSAERLANFIRVSTEELKDFARITGNDDVHMLSSADLCTSNPDIARHTGIEHAGGKLAGKEADL